MVLELALTFESFLLAVVAYASYIFIKNKVISPLKSVPGPWHTSFTSLEYTLGAVRGTQIPKMVNDHRKYGPVLRLGPNTVSIADVEAIHAVSNTHKVRKAPMYDHFHFGGAENVFSTRKPELFKKRRRLVAPTFTLSSLAEMEPIIISGPKSLSQRLDRYSGTEETIDLLSLFSYMTFDLIGELAFGKSFGLIEGKDSPVPRWLSGLINLDLKRAFIGPLADVLFPNLKKCERNIIAFTLEAIQHRRSQGGIRQDSLQKLLDAEDADTGNSLSDKELVSETILQLVGGTDTTSLTMTWAVHMLLEHPECMKRLQAELDAALPDANTSVTNATVRELPYLNAVISETLRFHPVGGTHLERLSPPGGITLCGHYIPEGTTILLHHYTLHHLEKYWPEPDSFLPERWLVPQERLNEMQRAFMPFSMGVRPCLGRHLAWLEMRMTLATVIRRFDLKAVSGADMTPLNPSLVIPAGGVLNVTVRRRVK